MCPLQKDDGKKKPMQVVVIAIAQGNCCFYVGYSQRSRSHSINNNSGYWQGWSPGQENPRYLLLDNNDTNSRFNRQRQLHDEVMSGCNQPANISVLNRR
jgi:hypothetical protein